MALFRRIVFVLSQGFDGGRAAVADLQRWLTNDTARVRPKGYSGGSGGMDVVDSGDKNRSAAEVNQFTCPNSDQT